ncbi:DNA-binding response OmpR family regulator [Arcanobacterium wilhelmae]|uniref:DNA-binding response OmpR family regulator n=1 Tax=Arcanobacterium wilhelmae TaxID=1803177 RepID=A0ABT9NC98_9ACTO|nr:response regulator transcription factor [Arcanobacterium wilhelmae]MDP9801328.1 DNA-binding response OmpR family regulator [Arcanobacterium wilhelmae]WFN90667.1 response regulator transcription factor [Arcanobacterium wilhelmae]
MAKVVLVEDDAAISGPLVRALTREGYEVVAASSGAEGIAATAAPVDLVILDLGLPDMDGLDVARRIRHAGLAVPILILTARTEEIDMVVGLDAGADDYVTKPFRLAELLARVRALLRRASPSENSVGTLEAQDVRIDPVAHRAYLAESELSLTGKEFELLMILVRNAGRVVSRDALMAEVWGDSADTSTKKLDMHISWLRRKLGDSPARPHYISTVRGMGFRFENA